MFLNKNKINKHTKRPMQIKFYDKLSGVWFTESLAKVQMGLNKATALLQKTGFVALEELYSFWGVSDCIKLMYDVVRLDLSYTDPREVLGWHLDMGLRIIDAEFIPKMLDDGTLYCEIDLCDLPEFWDISYLLCPDDYSFDYEEWLTDEQLLITACGPLSEAEVKRFKTNRVALL